MDEKLLIPRTTTMNDVHVSTKITVTCPDGHRLRGGTLLVGKTVRCPKCHTEFVFAGNHQRAGEKRSVTDTGVLRILGEMPKPPASLSIDERMHRKQSVTDTGVMRILGDMPETPRPASVAVPHRPCSRCGVPIPETLAVCNHCHCYVGVLPTFMRQLTPDEGHPN